MLKVYDRFIESVDLLKGGQKGVVATNLAARGSKNIGFDLLRGKNKEFRTGVKYEPRTLLHKDYLKRVLEETPEEVKDR